MNILIDKLIIFILCVTFYIPNTTGSLIIVPILIVIIISAIFTYMDNDKLRTCAVLLFAVICIYNPVFLFFVPLVFYDVIYCNIKKIWIPPVIGILYTIKTIPVINIVIVISFIVIAVLLKYRTVSLGKIKDEYYKLRDSSKEMSLVLEIKNKELIEKQDNEINLATLNERNRIARDIHDNVGHMLSSSILQVGAILATSSEDNTKENLRLVNSTLKNAMDNIRNSVHNLHEQAFDLHSEIKSLTDNFTFCKAELIYDVQMAPDKKLKNCFIMIIKEALANIIKHSNATKVTVSLLEHPALYQLVIHDDGTKIRDKSFDGMGLDNISDRVSAFNGNLNISSEKGFRIFISIPKGERS